MQDNKKILVHYGSPNVVGEKMDVALSISNEFGFVSDVTALFNRRGEQPGAMRCSLAYDESKSNDVMSTFVGTIKFDSPGYRTFYISLKVNGEDKKIEYNEDEDMAVFADDKNFAFWECFSHYYFKTPDWIKGAVMYQIFVDTFCSYELPEEFNDRVVPWDTFPKWKRDPDGVFRNDQRYGGNIKGIIKKLPYIRSLVPEETTIVLYLTPITKSPSQNGYDTSDYEKVHEMFGDWECVETLVNEAHKRNMKVILDVVFNHSSNENPLLKEEPEMYSWIHKYTKVACWWGYEGLCEHNQYSPIYVKYLVKWLLLYAKYFDGVRLDVADNLIDIILKIIRKYFPKYIIGEVWKNAVTGDFREFFFGDELDAVMNYQFGIAIYRYIRYGNYRNFRNIVKKICKLYPKEALMASAIFCTSHDIPRMPNILVGDFIKEGIEYETPWDMEKDDYWLTNGMFDTDKFRQWEFDHDQITGEKLELALNMQGIALFLQYTLPGLPSIFAGDEAGSMGFKDPMNRKPFPWNNINPRFLNLYKKMGELRNRYRETFAGTKSSNIENDMFMQPISSDFTEINFSIIEVDEKKLVYKRDNLLFVVNRTSEDIWISEYNIKSANFALKNVEEEHVLSAYNAVVIEM